jgi:hypothetical protein
LKGKQKMQQWYYLPGIPAYTWLPPTLEKERNRLAKAIEKAFSLREKANEAQFDFTVDEARDRRPAMNPIAAALKAEIEVRESLVIFYNAAEQVSRSQRDKIRGEQLSFEQSVREKLAIPDYIQMPILVLQTERKYWELRKKLDDVQEITFSSEVREQSNAFAVAVGQLKTIEGFIRGEPGRLDKLEKARIANQAQAAVHEAIDEERRTVRDRFFDRVAALVRG